MDRRRIAALAVWAVIGVTASAAVADWPQFLGPGRDGVSPQKGIDRTLGGGKPTVLWTVKVGPGFGGPAIHGKEVFVLDRQGTRSDAKDVLRCLDLASGKEKWTFSYDAPGRLSFDGSRSVPTVTDEHVFIVGPFGHVHGVSRKTHKAVWSKHMVKDLGAMVPMWGVVQNPLLDDGKLVVCVAGAKAGVLALEPKTGKTIWRGPSLGRVIPDSGRAKGRFMGYYSSAMPATLGGVKQYLAVGNDCVVGVRARDGRELWRYTGYNCRIQIPSPVQVGKDKVFISGGYGAGTAMLQITSDGGSFSVKEVWKLDADTCGLQTHQPLLLDGYLYGNSNSNEHSQGMVCLDPAEGKVLWQTRREPNFQRGNLIAADGLIFNLDGRTGILHLIEPTPKAYKELAQAKLLSGKNIWGPMALSDGKLVLRDQKQMKCIVVAK